MVRLVTVAIMATAAGVVATWFHRRHRWGVSTAAAWWIYIFGVLQITLGTPRQVSSAFCASNRDLDRWRLVLLGGLREAVTSDALSARTASASAQLGANVVVFVPLGILVAQLRRHHLTTVAAAAGAAMSFCIEMTQRTGSWWLYACPFRTADIDDLWCNTLGAALGGALVSRHRRRQPGPLCRR